MNIEVEPHADGIGRHQKIHIAILIKLNLRIAGARRERAHHHGRPTALAADQFGNGVNLTRRERDNGRPRRLARNLLGAGIGQMRKSRPINNIGIGQELADHRLHRRRTQQQGLIGAARIQNAVGKHMAPIKVDRGLDFIDRHAIDANIGGHRLDRTHPIARLGRNNALLARHQCNGLRADALDHAGVHLAGQQAQRQADHPGGMGQHALDGKIGLASIGRAQDGLDRLGGGKTHRGLCNACWRRLRVPSANVPKKVSSAPGFARRLNAQNTPRTKQHRIGANRSIWLCSRTRAGGRALAAPLTRQLKL